MDSFLLVTLDGGAAAGKSSTSARLAERLHLLHVDTGSHYRALTLWLTQRRCSVTASEVVSTSLQELVLGTILDGRKAVLTLDGERPEPAELRSDDVNAAVSSFAALPCVREKLMAYQRGQVDVARAHDFRGLVMEGRDIGSVIFPEARHRFFLEADERTRAKRRQAEGQTDAIGARDRADATRKTAPLTCPEGATRIDTSQLSLDAVVQHIEAKLQH